MDGFMNMAKSGYSAYQAHNSQQDVNKTGGSEYNQPEHDFDHDQAVQKASSNAAGSGDSSLFSQALSYATSNKSAHQQPVDEESTINAHKTAYEDGDASKLDANGIGGAAALQVLKQYTSGGSGGGGGGKSQSDLIGLAMSEAAKLFDSKGGAQSGDKQEAVNGAAMTIVKLLVQSKFGGGTTGGADQKPGLGSLLGGGGSGGGRKRPAAEYGKPVPEVIGLNERLAWLKGESLYFVSDLKWTPVESSSRERMQTSRTGQLPRVQTY